MTIEKFTELFEILVAAYPGHKFKDENDMGRTIVVWYNLLNDLPAELLQAAIHKHILQSGNSYFPSINEIRLKAAEITMPQTNTAADAWGEVIKAVKKFGWVRQEEALSSMNPLTRKVTGNVGFRAICMADESEIGVVRGQFLKMYDQTATRQKQDALLPEGLKKQIQALAKSKEVKKIAKDQG